LRELVRGRVVLARRRLCPGGCRRANARSRRPTLRPDASPTRRGRGFHRTRCRRP